MNTLPTVSNLFGFLDVKQSGNGWWRCVCPVHGSRNGKSRTLCMKIGDMQPVIFWCHAGCSFEDITEELGQWGMWPVQPDPWYRPPPQAELDAEAARRRARVFQINDELLPAKGTRVEQYLLARGVELLPELQIMFHPRLFHDLRGTSWPAMVAAIRDNREWLIGLSRTYLRYDRPGKAPVDPPKLSLGSVRGAAVHLAPAGPTLLIGEGIETTLSVMQETDLPGWATLGTSNMLNVDLPAIVREVLIAADGDDPGRDAARRAGHRWQRLGRRVRIMQAPADRDWNDVLRGAV